MFKIIYLLVLLIPMSVFSAKNIVIIGDSLTEGYGIEQKDAFPALIEKKLAADNLDYKVINGGVSGSTTASGVSRLKWFLKSDPVLIVLALGANDGLRGIKVTESEKNLRTFIEMAQKNNIKLILAGMQMPPNYGADYTQKFKSLYPKLAKKYNIPLIPFILKGVAGEKDLNLPDGIHPNPKGHQKMSELIYPYIKSEL